MDWVLLVAYLQQKEVEDLSYVFCTDDYLLDLNKKFLRHNTFTDIITFDYSKGKKISAEIYISTQRVEENAKNLGVPFRKELHRVMIHGVLHCMGYSDKTQRAKSAMRKKEDKYLDLLSEMA